MNLFKLFNPDYALEFVSISRSSKKTTACSGSSHKIKKHQLQVSTNHCIFELL